MNKIAVIFLSFTVLFQSFNLNLEDLPKIPHLFEHIKTHIQQGESLREFIAMHYGCEIDFHKNEHKEHQNLPFKKQNFDAHFNIDFIICNNLFPLQTYPKDFVSTYFMYKEQPIKLFETHIFQPPRLV